MSPEGRHAVLNGKRLEDQDEEVADRTLAPVTSSGCPRKRGSQGPAAGESGTNHGVCHSRERQVYVPPGGGRR